MSSQYVGPRRPHPFSPAFCWVGLFLRPNHPCRSVDEFFSLSLSFGFCAETDRERERDDAAAATYGVVWREATMRRDAMPALFWSAAFIGRRWLHVPVRPKTLEREERVEVKLQKSQTTQLRCQIIVCQRRRRESIFPQYWGRARARAAAHYTGMD